MHSHCICIDGLKIGKIRTKSIRLRENQSGLAGIKQKNMTYICYPVYPILNTNPNRNAN